MLEIIPKFRVIVIEDSLMGIQSAKEHNFSIIAFNWFNNEKINNLSDISVSSYKGLRAVFGLSDNTSQQTNSADGKNLRG